MNILFDFISLQDNFVNGGNEYAKIILSELLKNKDINIFGVYKNDNIPDFLLKIINEYKISLINIESNLTDFIKKNNIDIFYILIAQRFAFYDLTKIPCKIVFTIHDLGDLSQIYDNKITSKTLYLFEKNYVYAGKIFLQFKLFLQRQYHKLFKSKIIKKAYSKISKLIQQDNVYVVTVSEYSKYAIKYFFNNIKNQIKVFYPPQKTIDYDLTDVNNIENLKLKNMISKKEKFFLLMNCDRKNKNAALCFEIWDKFCKETDYRYKALCLGKITSNKKNIEVIEFLSEIDLEFAFKYCFALIYPSITEGFGYPPVETMKYGTPIICSNVTSLQDIYINAAISFSPFYPEDLYKALFTCINNYNLFKEKSFDCGKRILNKQEEDLNKLIDYILSI